MKDWKKAVLWTLVGFCMISVVIGVFNLFAFLQTVSIEIDSIGIEEATHNFYKGVTAAALICAIASIAMIVTTVIFFAKNKEADRRKFIFVSLIVILAISLLLIVFAFCTQPIFEAEKFDAYWNYGNAHSFCYSDYYHYQSYLSAMLSTFLPLLIAGGIIFGYLIYSLKTQNGKETTADSENEF